MKDEDAKAVANLGLDINLNINQNISINKLSDTKEMSFLERLGIKDILPSQHMKELKEKEKKDKNININESYEMKEAYIHKPTGDLTDQIFVKDQD